MPPSILLSVNCETHVYGLVETRLNTQLLATISTKKIVAQAKYCYNCFITNVTLFHDVGVTLFFVYSFIE